MLLSNYRPLVPVTLPFQGRQHYMHGFDLASPSVPNGFGDYLQIVKDLCKAAGAFIGKAFLTIDEKVIPAGMSQRKPGPHVDGCFIEHMNDWSGGSGGGWNHTCNAVPFKRMPVIVASDVPLCKAWSGTFNVAPIVGHATIPNGDLSHADLGEGKVLLPNMGYLFSPDCIHESMRVSKPTKRTFIRIALPTDFEPCLSGQAL